jgi:hypothetical protein
VDRTGSGSPIAGLVISGIGPSRSTTTMLVYNTDIDQEGVKLMQGFTSRSTVSLCLPACLPN